MNKTKTQWPDTGLPGETPKLITAVDICPPTLGWEMGWIVPKYWWRPFINIHLFHLHFQIGYIYTGK